MNIYLEQLVNALPIVRQMFDHDVYISVMDSDRKVVGFSVPDGVKPKLSIGDLFEDPSGALDRVLRTGAAQHNRLPENVMGEAFEGELVPVLDDGKVVGCIACTYSVTVREQMAEIANKFQESVNKINDSLHTLVNGLENLFTLLTDMNGVTSSVEQDVQNAVGVVNKINSNASRSNILALNASIEAARSGEYGRGFNVVATQMGQLANDSGSSANAIKATLNTIMGHLASIVSSTKDASDFAKEYTGNIVSIQEILEEMTVLAQELEEDIKN